MINSRSGIYTFPDGSFMKNQKGYRILEILTHHNTSGVYKNIAFMILNIDTQCIDFVEYKRFQDAKFIADEDTPYGSMD